MALSRARNGRAGSKRPKGLSLPRYPVTRRSPKSDHPVAPLPLVIADPSERNAHPGSSVPFDDDSDGTRRGKSHREATLGGRRSLSPLSDADDKRRTPPGGPRQTAKVRLSDERTPVMRTT